MSSIWYFLSQNVEAVRLPPPAPREALTLCFSVIVVTDQTPVVMPGGKQSHPV